MQFRICESQLAQESIDKKLIFLAKLEKCILPSFQKFPKRGIPRFGNSQNEGSLKSGIPEMRAATKVCTSPAFCKKYQAIVNVSSDTSSDLQILNCL